MAGKMNNTDEVRLILLLAKIFGRIVGMAARTQTRLLTKAQSIGWKPTDFEAAKLVHRQHKLFHFDRAKQKMKALKKKEKLCPKVR